MASKPPPDLAAQDVIDAAMRRLGAENAPQLADRLGMTKRNQERTVGRWLEGRNEPSWPYAIKLLAAVDLLRPDAEKRLREALG